METFLTDCNVLLFDGWFLAVCSDVWFSDHFTTQHGKSCLSCSHCSCLIKIMAEHLHTFCLRDAADYLFTGLLKQQLSQQRKVSRLMSAFSRRKRMLL